jgi:hypothetical protein
MRYSSKSTLLLLVLLGLMLLTVQLPTWGSEIRQLAGDRVTVFYPSAVPDEFATQILRDEEKALPYVENFLNVRYQGTVEVYITIGRYLFGVIGASEGAIGYDYPPWYFQNQQAIPGYALVPTAASTHEMTHVVAGNN